MVKDFLICFKSMDRNSMYRSSIRNTSIKLEDIEEAYHLFENKLDGVIKVAITP